MKNFHTLQARGQLNRLRQLARAALADYAIVNPTFLPLRHETNTTFRVQTPDGSTYVLRIHRPQGHTFEQIRSELQWLSALRHDLKAAVPEPIPTRDGALLTIASAQGVPEPRICVLFRWLPGRFFNDTITPGRMAHIGRLTALFHTHTSHWQAPSDFRRGRADALTEEGRQRDWRAPAADQPATDVHPGGYDAAQAIAVVTTLCSSSDAAIVTAALERIRAVFHELGESREVFGLIHGDLHQENYFFHGGSAGAIDFDDCGWGHFLFDLSITLREIQDLPSYPALRAALLRGYRAVRPLPSDHERHLEAFFALRHIQILMWILESHDHPAFRDDWVAQAHYEIEQLRQFVIRGPIS
ncbi:aminoglycoside phosphotransferase (plasmid) [Herpetosiphon aurantiacus DSM 785]|uniref:Aminoglycoside phosphotransferase n=1 Tax=Herpetosiphon aurantiacus (strain ATCC 23779 / DSM 785 / 114-95) TaxID=316274 RepID=A9B8K7_HERA2|nr:aminoglycoside phosphotransferase [Herpetosiphon aurantiacus DSM 785]